MLVLCNIYTNVLKSIKSKLYSPRILSSISTAICENNIYLILPQGSTQLKTFTVHIILELHKLEFENLDLIYYQQRTR